MVITYFQVFLPAYEYVSKQRLKLYSCIVISESIPVADTVLFSDNLQKIGQFLTE